MIRRKIPLFAILLLVILILRFTGMLTFWTTEGVANVCHKREAPVIPSFSIAAPRNHVQVSALMINVMREEKASKKRGTRLLLPVPVKKYLDVFTTSGRRDFRKGLHKAGRYVHVLGPVLNEYGFPAEMLILAYVESGFKMNARSRANAVGPWQFIEETAKRYGLRVDEHVDERQDFVKSTHAAGRYLRDLYMEFGTLELALAAYNAGESRVRTAILLGGSTDFWKLARAGLFPRQTVNYVAKFSAALILTRKPNVRESSLSI
ncbi:MAG: lytic transglycosylase domain-containing protein [Candidatus Glassbacteria bacterium]